MKKITKMLFSSALSVMLLFTGCGKNSGTEITNPPSDLSANNISEAEISSSSARVSVKDTDFIVNDKSFWIMERILCNIGDNDSIEVKHTLY